MYFNRDGFHKSNSADFTNPISDGEAPSHWAVRTLHSLSRLMPGWQRFALLGCTWKFLMPTLPKLILWWCCPPALPRPPGCFLCLPILPWPWLTCPLSFLVFFLQVAIASLVEVNQAIKA